MSKIQKIGGQTLIGGLNRVYHCNHYNAHLQMSVLMSEGIDNHAPERLLIDAVTPLILKLKENGYQENDLVREFSFCGYGTLHAIDDRHWGTPNSHYSQSIYLHGKAMKTCFFNTGYIQGITETYGEEICCQQLGDKADIFSHSNLAVDTPDYLIHTYPLRDAPERFDFAECQAFDTRVDEQKIISAVAGLPLYGRLSENQDGLIHAFGVVLTNHFADYYNRISYETYFKMLNTGIPVGDVKEMFVQAGHVCAFNTFGGIMSSPEWHAVAEIYCDDREDWFHAMVAVINALGWGMFRLEKIDVEQELVMRVYNSYEGVGFRRMYPAVEDKNMSFLVMGAVLGLVHLLWKVDIREKPTLDEKFYVTQFNNSENSYSVEQTHAIAAGDDFDRVVIKSPNK